jgi:hypothetical protein
MSGLCLFLEYHQNLLLVLLVGSSRSGNGVWPEMVEMLAPMKDWELEDAKLQHSVKDQELEDSPELVC